MVEKKISVVVAAVDVAELTPTRPDIPNPQASDDLEYEETDIQAAIYQLVRPWRFGIHLQRIARNCNLPLSAVKAIKNEIDSQVAATNPAGVELPEVTGK